MNELKRTGRLLPGFMLALLTAAAAKFLEGLLPVRLIGASVIALFLGMLMNGIRKPSARIAEGLKFTSKKILKLMFQRKYINF